MKWYRNKVPLRCARKIGSVLNVNVTTYDMCGNTLFEGTFNKSDEYT